MVFHYLVTITKAQKKDYVSVRELQEVIYHLQKIGVDCKYGKWERHGLYKQLHYHGIFTVPSGFLYSGNTHIAGMILNYERIRKPKNKSVIQRIKQYIDKHYHEVFHTQLDTELANYYNAHYAFE